MGCKYYFKLLCLGQGAMRQSSTLWLVNFGVHVAGGEDQKRAMAHEAFVAIICAGAANQNDCGIRLYRVLRPAQFNSATNDLIPTECADRPGLRA
jgi:hypothetical protein